MNMIQTITCPSCGNNVESKTAKNCTYCKSAFIFKSSYDLLGKTNKQIINYTKMYKSVKKEDEDYLDSQIALIALYLKRTLSGPAISISENLIKEFPDSAEVYLWKVISIIKEKGFRKLNLPVARKLVDLLVVGKSLSEFPEDFIFVGTMLQKQFFQKKSIVEPFALNEMLDIHDNEIEEIVKNFSEKDHRGSMYFEILS
jgi:hypothetical protein